MCNTVVSPTRVLGEQVASTIEPCAIDPHVLTPRASSWAERAPPTRRVPRELRVPLLMSMASSRSVTTAGCAVCTNFTAARSLGDDLPHGRRYRQEHEQEQAQERKSDQGT